MNKLNLLYDITYLAESYKTPAMGTGIYTVAKGLLHCFLTDNRVSVCLYTTKLCDPLIHELEKQYPNRFKVIKNTLLDRIQKKITNLKTKIKQRINLINMISARLRLPFYNLFFTIINKKTQYIFGKIDTYLSPVYIAPPSVANQLKIAKYLIIHDIIPLLLDNQHYRPAGWFKELIDNIPNQNYRFFAVSNHTKKDFVKHVGLKADRILVTPLACEERYHPRPLLEASETLAKKYPLIPNQQYVFTLSALEPRKNLIRIVKTFASFIIKHQLTNLVLIIGGIKARPKTFELLVNEIAKLGPYQNQIILAGYLGEEDLPHFYSKALWFVYTSQYEGFGLPPLEAMACGCPVIVSNNSSLPEVVADTGIMIDWDSDEQHLAAYETYYFNEKIRLENSRKGLLQASKFSWQKTSDLMINAMYGSLKETS